jgi:hypothetical protein
MHGLDTVGIRTGRWKLVRYSTGEWELYDLRHDPIELRSLRGRATRDIRHELERVWRRYAACARAECRGPLANDLRTGPGLTRRITRHQEQQRQRYYRY